MSPARSRTAPARTDPAGARRGPVRVALVVPMQGPTGIYGPSCLCCAELAVEQLNAADGIAGRPVELVLVDAGRDPEVVAADVSRLVGSGRVEAVAGWHISAVRVAVARRIAGRVVYAYAAMHEGWDDTPGVFMLGERPVNQLLPALRWLRENVGASRWLVVGNDYVFPRVTGATTRAVLDGSPSRVVAETYLPLGTQDFSPALDAVRSRDVDGVIMLLMGQDAVHFNRQFARAGLSEDHLRVSPAVEENTLLGGGAHSHRGLYAAAAFFDRLDTPESAAFTTAYYRRFGPLAPALNAVGESCYEALHFLARMGRVCGSLAPSAVGAAASGHFYDSPRGLLRFDGNLLDQDVHLAVADGLEFDVVDQIARTG